MYQPAIFESIQMVIHRFPPCLHHLFGVLTTIEAPIQGDCLPDFNSNSPNSSIHGENTQKIATWDELVIFTSKNVRVQESHQQIDPPVTKTATPSGKSSLEKTSQDLRDVYVTLSETMQKTQSLPSGNLLHSY